MFICNLNIIIFKLLIGFLHYKIYFFLSNTMLEIGIINKIISQIIILMKKLISIPDDSRMIEALHNDKIGSNDKKAIVKTV